MGRTLAEGTDIALSLRGGGGAARPAARGRDDAQQVVGVAEQPFGLPHLRTALVPAISATALAGTLAVLLARRATRFPRRPAMFALAWTALLITAVSLSGRTGLGTALTAAFLLQVTPSVWTAYRGGRTTGISAGTWLLILARVARPRAPRALVLKWEIKSRAEGEPTPPVNPSTPSRAASTDLAGRTVVITGASDGIGAAAARHLAGLGARVIVAGRSAEKTAAVADSIGATALTADFARLEDVRRVAGQILALCPRIDVLANNAGAMFPTRMVTVDGNEMTFQVNHLAGFLLTGLLLPRLAATPGSRVLTTSSMINPAGGTGTPHAPRNRVPRH